MKEREPDFSRMSRKNRRGRSNKILNILIGVVVVLIVFTAGSIILGDKDKDEAEEKDITLPQENNDKTTDDNDLTQGDQVEQQADADDDTESKDQAQVATGNDNADKAAIDPVYKDQETNNDANKNDGKNQLEDEKPGTVTYAPSDDDVISESIVNTTWQPIGTAQTGNHISSYDGESEDWNEKKKALAYATGLSEDSMIFWKIKNGGGPQKSVGVVSSKDKSQKYRVHLEWVDGEGWKPVKMDVLNTLDFDY